MIKQNDLLKPVSKSGFNIVGLLGLIVLSLFLKQAGKKLFNIENLLPKLFKNKDINEKFNNENTLDENINGAKLSGIFVNLAAFKSFLATSPLTLPCAANSPFNSNCH